MELNGRLKARKLVLDDSGRDAPAGGGPSNPGYLGEVKVTLTSRFVAVQTQLGLWCGLDESVYLFEWKGGQWRVRWESEENDYSKAGFAPLHWQHVLVSPANPEDDHLILEVGIASTCMSSWSGGLICRLWRMRPDSPPKLLLDYSESERVYWDGDSLAALGSSDFSVQFRVGSIDGLVHNHAAVRHYRIESDQVQQIDPFVLIPRDFVDTWVADPWSVSSGRSESARLKRLEEVHGRFKPDVPNGDFGQLRGPSLDYLRRCADNPDVWQVRLFTSDVAGRGTEALYFLVQWEQPYHFAMVDVRDAPSPMCTKVDPDGEKGQSPFPDAK